MCNREQHSLASIEGEAFSPVKFHSPSVGECQGAEVGEGGWEREHFHGRNKRGSEVGIGEKEITPEM